MIITIKMPAISLNVNLFSVDYPRRNFYNFFLPTDPSAARFPNENPQKQVSHANHLVVCQTGGEVIKSLHNYASEAHDADL